MAERFYTRDEAIQIIREKTGAPISKSTIDKRGPTPDRWYGNRCLYTEPTLMTWAQSIISDKPSKLSAA